jgi:hypothetical protein
MRSSVTRGLAKSASQPVALKNDNRIDHNAVEASHKVSRYYTPDASHNIKFSSYGSKKALLESRLLKEPAVLTGGNGAFRLLSKESKSRLT